MGMAAGVAGLEAGVSRSMAGPVQRSARRNRQAPLFTNSWPGSGTVQAAVLKFRSGGSKENNITWPALAVTAAVDADAGLDLNSALAGEGTIGG